jgi:electron transfer flavoprotein beta subunit
MNIVILTKAVPSTVEDERLTEDLQIDRSVTDPIINPNDEHALEVALRLADADPMVRTTMLTMGPETAWHGLSKAVAAGIGRSVIVADPALANSCILSTARVLATALAREPFDLVLGGQDTSDGRGGVIVAAVATLLGLPFIQHASEVRVSGGEILARQERDDGVDIIAAPLPALVTVTQVVGELRYPKLRSIMATRSRRPEILTLGDLGLDPAAVGRAAATTQVVRAAASEARQEARVITGEPQAVARAVAEFLVERGFVA